MVDENILKINKILHESGYPTQINGLSDLKAFLNDPKNKSLKVFDEVEELYDILILGAGMW
jgi:hypothetical protein